MCVCVCGVCVCVWCVCVCACVCACACDACVCVCVSPQLYQLMLAMTSGGWIHYTCVPTHIVPITQTHTHTCEVGHHRCGRSGLNHHYNINTHTHIHKHRQRPHHYLNLHPCPACFGYLANEMTQEQVATSADNWGNHTIAQLHMFCTMHDVSTYITATYVMYYAWCKYIYM